MCCVPNGSCLAFGGRFAAVNTTWLQEEAKGWRRRYTRANRTELQIATTTAFSLTHLKTTRTRGSHPSMLAMPLTRWTDPTDARHKERSLGLRTVADRTWRRRSCAPAFKVIRRVCFHCYGRRSPPRFCRVECGNIEMLSVLIASGADLLALAGGLSVLDSACVASEVDAASFALACGCRFALACREIESQTFYGLHHVVCGLCSVNCIL